MASEVSIDIAVETKKARQSIEKLEQSFEGFAKSAASETKKATGAMETFQGVIGAQAVVSAVSAITNSVFSLGSAFVSEAAKTEGYVSQLTTLLGSAQSAGDLLDDVKQFAAGTPFTLPGLAEATKQLLSFGFEQENIIDKLTKIGDVAAGSGADFNDLTLIYGQVAAAGKLTGERLLQLQERAIPIGPALAKTLGVAEESVRELVSKGVVDLATFEKAFASLSGEGGQFFEGAIRQSKTFDGVVSTLQDNLGLAASEIGEGILPILKTLGIATINLVQNNKELISSFSEFLALKLNEALDLVVGSIEPLGTAIVFLNDVFNGLLSVWDIAKLSVNELAIAFIDTSIAIAETARATAEFLGLDTSNSDSTVENLNTLKETFEETSDGIVVGIQKRVQGQRDFDKAVTETTTLVSTSLSAQIEKERELSAAVVEEGDKIIAKKKETATVELTEKQKINAKILELEEAKTAGLVELKAKEQLALQELETIENDRKEEARVIKLELDTEQKDERLVQLIETLGAEEAIQAEAEARRLDAEGKVAQAKKVRLDQDGKLKKAILAKNAKEEMGSIFRIQKFDEMTQKEKLASVQSNLGLIAGLQESGNKKLFIVGKTAAIATATIDGVLGVQKALASLPFPANVIAAGSVGVAAAVNVSKIASQSFAGGGVVPGIPSDGDNQIANVASGEVILNRRQQAETLFNIANGGGSGGGGGGLSVNIEAGIGGVSTEQVDFLIDEINNRTEFGNQELRSA